MKKKFTALMLSLSLCLALIVPAFAASDEVIDSSTITVSVTELEPGYYLCAVWYGDTLLRLFDYTVGQDGKMEATVEIGAKLKTGDQVIVGISNANTDAADGEPIPPITCTVKNTSSGNPTTPGNPSASTTPSTSSGGGYYPPPAAPAVTVDKQVTGRGTFNVSIGDKKITIVTSPTQGNVVDTITVTDANGNVLTVIKTSENHYECGRPSKGGKVTVSVVFKPEAFINPFTDVFESDWFYDDVAYVAQNGLMDGVGNQQFDPYGTTTRGMTMTVLARQNGVDTSGSTPWYQMGIKWAMQAGVSDGTSPGANITREQFATMLWRYAGEPAVIGDLSDYPDASAIHSDWAGTAMIWAVQNGIIKGSDGKLNPQGNALRSEVAAMLTRFCQNIEK